MVFQSYALWPHMTIAAEPRDAPQDPQGTARTARRRCINEALDKVGLAHSRTGTRTSSPVASSSASRSPAPWSTRRQVLLLDEPLSNLDAKLREQARAWLKRLQSELGITTVYVTHDQDEALAHAATASRSCAVVDHAAGRHAARDLRDPGHGRSRRLRRPLQLPARHGRRSRRAASSASHWTTRTAAKTSTVDSTAWSVRCRPARHRRRPARAAAAVARLGQDPPTTSMSLDDR